MRGSFSIEASLIVPLVLAVMGTCAENRNRLL